MGEQRLTRRSFFAGACLAGAGLTMQMPAGMAGQSPSPVAEAGTIDFAMAGGDPANTRWRPGPARDGVPAVGQRILPGYEFSLALREEAGMLVRDGVLYARGRRDTGDGVLFALDAVTGDERWSAAGADALLAIAPSAAIVQRLGRNGAPDTVAAIAADGSGDDRWRIEARAQGRTVLIGDLVLVSTSDGPLAIDVATGTVAWDQRGLELGKRSAIAAGDGILVGSEPTETAHVRAFSLDTGDVQWQTELDRPVQTAPLIAGSSAWVCDPLELVELDLHTGEERRRIALRQAMPYRGHLALAETTLIVSDRSGLSAIDIEAGEVRWAYAPRFGTAFEFHLAGETAWLLVNDGVSADANQAVQAIDLASGVPRWQAPEPGSEAALDDVRQLLVAGESLWLASTNGLRACAFSDLPDPGIASPVQGNTFTSEAAGFSYTWTDEWEPGDTDWFLGEDGLRFQSIDGQALVTQYVDDLKEPLSADEIAWAIAGVPPGGTRSLEAPPLVVAFPRTFGPDTSRLRGLEAAAPPELSDPVPAEAGEALVLASTVLNPPFDRMLVLIVTVPLADSGKMLVFEFGTAESLFDERLPSFLTFFEHLQIG